MTTKEKSEISFTCIEAFNDYITAIDFTRVALDENTDAINKATEALTVYNATKANMTAKENVVAKANLADMFKNLRLASEKSHKACEAQYVADANQKKMFKRFITANVKKNRNPKLITIP
jgi:hypothetical protein